MRKAIRQANAYDDSGPEELVDAYDRRRAARHTTLAMQHSEKSSTIHKARQAAAGEGSDFGHAVRAHGFTLE